jgi:bifunctional non-homologous end joining protein LigD
LTGGRDDDLAYFVFDLLHLDGRDLTSAPLVERKAALRALIDRAPRGLGVVYSDHVVGRGPDFLAAACRHRLEGVVSKRADSRYVAGRGRDWVKSKCKRGQELVVGGWTDPAGARQGFGALLVGVHDATGALRFAGKIGTGYTDGTLAELKERLAAVETDVSPFVDPPRGAEARGVHWTEPKLVVEAEFTEWTSDGKLRHPSFKGLRADKPASDIVREEPKTVPDKKSSPHRASSLGVRHPVGTHKVSDTVWPAKRSLTPSGRPRGVRHRVAGRGVSDAGRGDAERATVAGVAISHPERVLYPDQGLTKLDLARYYEAIADWVLPHVRDRLLTLVRCPDGSEGQCFYQKHGGFGLSERVRRVPVKEKTKTDEYLAVDDLAGVVSLVQIGVLELHLWGSRADRMEEPDRMIFDLDPDPSVPWPRVVEGARLLRERLAKLGLDTFLKTTGGKGLHVVAPLARRAEQDWDVVKEFSRRVVEGVVREAPERYTANMRKAERAGRIFIDYLRNGRGATAVAPYSPRARKNAPVATPITWDELDDGARSDSFTVKTVGKRLASLRRDPWAGIDKTRQTLTKSMRRDVGMA